MRQTRVPTSALVLGAGAGRVRAARGAGAHARRPVAALERSGGAASRPGRATVAGPRDCSASAMGSSGARRADRAGPPRQYATSPPRSRGSGSRAPCWHRPGRDAAGHLGFGRDSAPRATRSRPPSISGTRSAASTSRSSWIFSACHRAEAERRAAAASAPRNMTARRSCSPSRPMSRAPSSSRRRSRRGSTSSTATSPSSASSSGSSARGWRPARAHGSISACRPSRSASCRPSGPGSNRRWCRRATRWPCSSARRRRSSGALRRRSNP